MKPQHLTMSTCPLKLINGPTLAVPMARPEVLLATCNWQHELNHSHGWIPQHRQNADGGQNRPNCGRSEHHPTNLSHHNLTQPDLRPGRQQRKSLSQLRARSPIPTKLHSTSGTYLGTT
ncbi:hypothetical protein L484_000842 [Morus notabilis]|uniref:Uncharacterized protein n=1 Tax=Morus notabilis TaxID=981085 RepID=W9SDK7_9ROSA|nr:hypothetical protein L484_002559 [Morus notabilis]EXC36416.1 hypothetical protein L484_000842 [Morus notabilis]